MKMSIVSSIIWLVIAVDLAFAVPTAYRQKRWDWFSRASELYNNVRDHLSDAVDTVGDVADTIGVHAREHLNLAADQLEDMGVPRERLDEAGEQLNNITSQVVQRGQEIIENGTHELSRVAEHAMNKARETIENNRDVLENSHKDISRVADSMADMFGNFRDLVNVIHYIRFRHVYSINKIIQLYCILEIQKCSLPVLSIHMTCFQKQPENTHYLNFF